MYRLWRHTHTHTHTLITYTIMHHPQQKQPQQDAGFLFASFGLLGVLALLYMKRLCRLFNDVQARASHRRYHTTL